MEQTRGGEDADRVKQRDKKQEGILSDGEVELGVEKQSKHRLVIAIKVNILVVGSFK